MNATRSFCRRISFLLLALCLAACAGTPTKAPVGAITPVTLTPSPTSAPTHTPRPEPTATETTTPPSPTSSVTASPMATETLTPTPEGTPLATPIPGTYAVIGVDLDDTLNVRAGPGTDHPVAATIPPYGTGVTVTGDGVQVGRSVWVPVRYGDLEGWANSRYLAQQRGRAEEPFAARAAAILAAIQARDLAELSRYVHPTLGVRFSPYAYVRPQGDGAAGPDLHFSAGELVDLPGTRTVYRWGTYDGVGDPIDLTFDEYWDRFVYDVDFALAHVIGYNERVGQGNSIDNSSEVYPRASVIEYHLTGFDLRFEGLDWRSLRLVLEKLDGEWYLVGIVHDEWTV